MKYTLTLIILIALNCSFFAQSQFVGIYTTDSLGLGQLFRANENGVPVSVLHSFDGLNGAQPAGNLIQEGSRFYGITRTGGYNNGGVAYYIDYLTNEFSTLQHLDSSFQTTLISNFVSANNTFYYTGNYTNSKSSLYEFDLANQQVSRVLVFPNSLAYYTPIAKGNDLFCAASKINGAKETVLYKVNTLNNQLSDSIVFDALVYGSQSTSIYQLNDSTVLLVNSKGAANNFGCIISVNTNDLSYSKLLDFTNSSTHFSPGLIHNNLLYFSSNNVNTNYGLSFDASTGLMDTLFSTDGSAGGINARYSNFTLENNTILFQTNDFIYRYSLATQSLILSNVVNSAIYGSGHYFNKLVRISMLDLNEEAQQNIAVYPNPTQANIHVTVEEGAQYTLFNLAGMQLSTGTFTEGLNSLDFSPFATGSYMLHIQNKGNTFVQKVIKQ